MTSGARGTASVERPADLSNLLVPLETARHRIDGARFRPWPTAVVPIVQAVGRFSAVTIRARVPEPAQRLAAMDGFAVRSGSSSARPVFRVDPGESRAGGTVATLARGHAIRVGTGAPLDRTTTAVLRWERARVDGDTVSATGVVHRDVDVIRVGEDYPRGAVLVARGEVVRPLHLAVLVASGARSLRVFLPNVRVIAIGDELASLGHRGVRDSIAPTLAALLRFGRVEVESALPDRPDRIVRVLRRAARRSDLVVTVGGSSVGAHDRTKEAVRAAGRLLFDGVRVNVLKRGAVGVVGRVPVAVLPGQVGSAVTVWHEHGLHVVGRCVGRDPRRFESVRLDRAVANCHRMDSVYLFRPSARGVVAARWGVHRSRDLLDAVGFGILPRGRTTPAGARIRIQRLD